MRRDIRHPEHAELGLEVAGWRVVPTDPSVCGERALATLPRIEQALREQCTRAGIRPEDCDGLGIGFLTLYAFSVENWKRPKREINALMRLLQRFLIDERDELDRNNVQLRVIGHIADLPERVRRVLDGTIDYLAKDYASFRRLMLDHLSTLAPDWQERNPTDLGQALVEVTAAGTNDGDGDGDSNTLARTINITPVNDAPIATNLATR